eukprot:CAMPEP_0195286050 /NCGR_PEP_ID=MMETSP0707-20130614/3657_1 /TAXON_ID=33640 /ORGANISM="Asterionellopsis glacialis, Strain CCMP134" /LENGTH=408 /DNA_ID=CAMNT_0040345643 /DNA_START=273 /DNA_END=1499 /DNA_ORIENTATION=-
MSDDVQSLGDGSLYSTESEKDILNKSFVRTILDSSSQRTLDGPGGSTKGSSSSAGGGAPRVSFSGVDSVTSEGSLRDKTVDQLIEKVESLTLAKKQVQIDLSAEKAVRKKKERNLIKLAKELNKRAEEQKKHAAQTTQMDDKVAKLQEKVETTKKELEQMTELQERKSHEHHVEITALQDKYRQAMKEHNEKTEDLRREILEANLTADKLRSKLARLEMVHAPDHADMIAERTMRDAMSTAAMNQDDDVTTPAPPRKKKTRIMVPLLMGMIAIVVGIMHNMDMLSWNAMCSPTMPGTTFSNTNASTEAPWWAPPPLKSPLFSVMCGEERVQTRMEYTHNSGNGQHKLALWSVPPTEEGGEGTVQQQQQPTLLWEKRIGSQVTIFPDHLVITDKRGKTEEVQNGLPWTL